MQNFNLYDVQISDLELFLNVAEFLSFTKAGEKMYMSQSWVSKRIQQLETHLGLVLFLRNTRSLTLTPAGRILKERLTGVTSTILDAIQAAHAVQTGVSGYLRIGYLEWGNMPFIHLLNDFLNANPQLSIDVYREQFPELRHDLASNRMDLIFTISYDCDSFPPDEYEMMNLEKTSLTAYMNVRHPLASKSEIEIADLRGEPIFMVDQKSSPGYNKYISQIYAEQGMKPNVIQYGANGGAFIGSIILGKGILLASESFLGDNYADYIIGVPIRNTALYAVVLWNRKNLNPMLMKFILFLSEGIPPEILSESRRRS